MKRLMALLGLAFVLACSTSIPSNAQSAKAKKAEAQEEQVYNLAMVELQPEFPGGPQTMYKWIAENINYPAEALADSVQGSVIVEFRVNKNGEIENPRVLRGRHPALDEEAIRVVKAMPKWKPAKLEGKPVRVTYILPIPFKLPPKQEPAK